MIAITYCLFQESWQIENDYVIKHVYHIIFITVRVLNVMILAPLRLVYVNQGDRIAIDRALRCVSVVTVASEELSSEFKLLW